MQVRTMRFGITVLRNELSVAVLHRYWRPICQTWPGIPRIPVRLHLILLVRAQFVDTLRLHIYRDLRAILAKRGRSSLRTLTEKSKSCGSS
jgi:hypothetical protein